MSLDGIRKLKNFFGKHTKPVENPVTIVESYAPRTSWEKRFDGFKKELLSKYNEVSDSGNLPENAFGAFYWQKGTSTKNANNQNIIEQLEAEDTQLGYLALKDLNIAVASGELENLAKELDSTVAEFIVYAIDLIEDRNQEYESGYYFNLEGLDAIKKNPNVFIEVSKRWYTRIENPIKTGKETEDMIYIPLDQIEKYSEVKA